MHHSPHHRFHGALGDVKSCEMIFEMYELDEQKKEKVAVRVLTEWQESNHNIDLYPIIEELGKE